MSSLILKLSGSLLIVFSSFAASCMIIEKLKAKVQLIEGLISGFISAEEHICGMLRPFEEAFLSAAEDAGSARDIFVLAATGEGDIKERFLKAFEGTGDHAVLQYISGVCVSDEAERRTAFSLIRNRLEQQYKQASDDYCRLSRLYSAAGVLGGLLVVILLL